MATKTVGDIIQGRPVIVIKPQNTLAEAFMKTKEFDIHRLPVVDDAGELVGILSVSDLRFACDSPLFNTTGQIEQHLQEHKVSEAMHKSVYTVTPSDSLLSVAKLLRVSGVSGFPVVEEGTKKVIGVVSRTDMLDELIRLIEVYPTQ
eukprot:TRINITY_DN2665_c0_g1_i4.p1 TRINITY_DN2665_c0_g1~~TRINITY_DN2665_c0_g1_i4.p1  ORF type:complete len:147 (+),score=19.86 TRINITY_DN2665_c0_g1_i4:133-573(+)